MPRYLASLLFFMLLVSPAAAQQLVAPTGPLTPAEQRAKFKLPPGFEIQLVASEPDVHKPMNLKFDARGRMWVTHSLEYPFPAKEGAEPRDSITIFSELGEDGRARKVQKFAEHLNIPIGVLPLDDASTIAWSIPNLYRFLDTNGDGVADEKRIAYGPFGFNDTHGNQNGLTRWLDGWVYACHGFNNHSQVKLGGEGEVVMDLQSGNSYRFRADGSRIEQVSWGQVNPFGLCFDPLGNMYTADCHSKPVTMILRGGYYQSFGKPHDGLGYAPEMTSIDHGGTGIAGVVYYDAQQFPPEFRDVLFVGNVITNRIHCDRLSWQGSSPTVAKVEDFLTCDDPWFRPVDVQLGPDGALYVLDFYNKIIGHYEVPLTHPERDRERGRVWRIIYKGEKSQQVLAAIPDMREASAEKLVELLGNANLNVRVMATNTLLDRFGKDAATLARQVLTNSKNPAHRAHAVWVVARTTGIDAALAKQLAHDEDRLVRTHLLQACGERTSWEPTHYEVVRAALADSDPFVRRAAVVALASHPQAENVAALCAVQQQALPEDLQLRHAARIALRNQLRNPEVGAQLSSLKLAPKDYQQVLELAALSPDGPAATLVFDAALRGEVDDALLAKALPSAARHIDPSKVEELAKFVKKRFAKDLPSRLVVLRALHEGLAARGLPAPESFKSELVEVMRGALAADRDGVWINEPVAGLPDSKSPWVLQKREYTDGANDIPLISSLPAAGGDSERLTGVLRSPKFKLPAQLSFWMCGHNGFPTVTDAKKCYIRLLLADGTEIARSYPPRADIAQKFSWDLAAQVGKEGYVEVVDSYIADAYAWLAVSRFEPAVIKLPEGAVGDFDALQADMLRLVGQMKLAPLSAEVSSTASDIKQTATVRLAACDALVALNAAQAIGPLQTLLSDAKQATDARQQAAELMGRIDQEEARQTLVKELKTAPSSVAVAIASSLAAKPATGELLLKEIGEGRASATLLREPTVVARLKAANIESLDARIKELTAKLSPTDNRIAATIKARRDGFLRGQYSIETGQAVFAKSACAQCHKIGNVGATIAPALDGIGSRGLDRLLEDTLDPNRNVDQAFRVTSITTTDGVIVSGFGLREEGQTLLMHDSTGKEQRVQLSDIDARQVIPLSPMPANLAEQIKEEEFYHLLEFLLSRKTK